MTNDDIKQISKLLDEKIALVQKVLEEHSEVLEQHGKILRSLKKDQGAMLKMLDNEQMQQRRRLGRVEKHLGISLP